MTIVDSMKLSLSFEWNILTSQFNFQRILIHLFSEATAEKPMNSHCCTDNFVYLFPIKSIVDVHN